MNESTATAVGRATGDWPEIVNLARWSPSVHNTQAWRVRPLDATTAELCYVPNRLLALTDANGMFYTIGMGIFVEALDVAAGSFGQTIRLLDPVPDMVASESAEPVVFGRIALEARAGEPEFAASLLRERRTSRIPYDGVPLTANEVDALTLAADGEAQRVRFTSNPDEVRWVVGLNIDTLFYDLAHAPARKEIGLWIRKSAKHARECRDGFSPKCIGFNGRLLSGFFQAHWLFDRPGIRDVIRKTYARSYRGTASVGWITGPEHAPDDWFASGRMLYRLWLTATRLGLVLHPFGSVITNPAAHAEMERRLPSEANGDTTWLLFRIGHSKTPPRSMRLPAAEVLI